MKNFWKFVLLSVLVGILLTACGFQTETIFKGELGEYRARTTSFEVNKGETVDIPILVTSYASNKFEISYPCCGNGACSNYADVLPSFGNIAADATIQLQLVGNHVGQCSTMLYITLYDGNMVEELEVPITITVTE